MKLTVLLFLFLSSLLSFEYNLSSSVTTNARTQYIEFSKEKNIDYKKLVVDKREYKIFNNPFDTNKMYALLPVSYYQKPSTQKVEIFYTQDNKDKIKSFFLKVKKANYKSEKIQVQKSKVNPKSKKVQQRISREYKEAMDIYSTYNKNLYIKEKFILPMESKITSDFGKARIYNNELNGYHSGTDFRAKIGTPILATNDGVVVLAKDRFYSGNSVIIDHGEGIYTCYYHLSGFKVKKGDFVKKSQQIGLSGDTGRVTGPHLHFSARVGGLQVDPLQLIELLNKNFIKKAI